MSQNHVKILEKAQEKLVGYRRDLAQALALGKMKGQFEEMVLVQNAIDAISRAIEHEKALPQPELE